MNISSIKLTNYRNLKTQIVFFGDRVNIVYGDNARGKTNLLEALWLFSGARSFRGAKDNEQVAFNESFAKLELNFSTTGYNRTAEIRYGVEKSVFLDNIKQSSITQLAGQIPIVCFSPAHLSLVEDGPSVARQFLDHSIAEMRPAFTKVLLVYERAMKQRNAILKEIREVGISSEKSSLIDVFENEMANSGSKIINLRRRFVGALNEIAPDVYSGISQNKETFELEYIFNNNSDLPGEDRRIACKIEFLTPESLIAQYKNSREIDTLKGLTSIGPHRDSLWFGINNKSARTYGSQGQKRSVVLALKLAQATLLEQSVSEKPLILLDDVMSELDEHRQEYILNKLDNMQVVITCCDPANVTRLTSGKVLHVENGMIL